MWYEVNLKLTYSRPRADMEWPPKVGPSPPSSLFGLRV